MLDFSRISEYTENNRVEAKTALGGFPESLWETYSAFANTMGGYILLGVTENPDRTFSTVDLPDAEKLLAEFYVKVNDPKRVSANLIRNRDLYTTTVNGNHIAVIYVPRAGRADRPVYVDGDIHNSFVRNGEGDIRLTSEQIQKMIREREGTTEDQTGRGNDTAAIKAGRDPEKVRRAAAQSAAAKVAAGRKPLPDSVRYMGAITVWLTDHACASARELAGKLELSTSQTRRYINRLIEKGIVEKQGNGLATKYRLKRKPG